jgi:hypothetical protein
MTARPAAANSVVPSDMPHLRLRNPACFKAFAERVRGSARGQPMRPLDWFTWLFIAAALCALLLIPALHLEKIAIWLAAVT